MTIRLHRGDLPDISRYKTAVAIDTETLGLNPHRDRLCVVQLSPGDGSAVVVQIPPGGADAPNLKRLLTDPAILKIFLMRGSTSQRCRMRSVSGRRRSIAPRSPRG
jgi:ribonuclease D